MPTDRAELLEEADCTHKLPGVMGGEAVGGRSVTAFGGQTGEAPQALLPGQDRAEPVRQGFVLPSKLVILVSLQKPLSR